MPKRRVRLDARARYKVGEQIQKKREELNMTLDDVATFLGVQHETVWIWENGTSTPHPKQTPKLIEFLGYDPYKILVIA